MKPPSKPQTGKQFEPGLEPPSKKGKTYFGTAFPEEGVILIEDDDDEDLMDEGGGNSSSRPELEDVVEVAVADFEAGVRNKGKRKMTEPRNLSPKKLQKVSYRITMGNISPGLKLWGVVSQVSQKDIVVSLPGGLRGLVRATDALDPPSLDWDLPSIFHVGQLVSCIVLKLDGDSGEKERTISLSLRLSLLHKDFSFDLARQGMVLSGYVKSIDDHGYMLHFGLNSFSGFMPKDNQSVAKLGTEVKVGQLIQGVVKKIDISQKLLYMSSDPDMVSKSVTKDIKGSSIGLLTPGMLVDATVLSSLENGVVLSFLTYFTGSADIFNLHETFPTSKWKDSYPPNKKVNARVLFIDPSTRAVGLTLNAHLVQNRPPPTLVEAGEKFDRSKVIRIDEGYGLLLEIPSAPTTTPAYVSISDVADKKLEKVGEYSDMVRMVRDIKVGSHMQVTVVGFRHLEGLATGTLKLAESKMKPPSMPQTGKQVAPSLELPSKKGNTTRGGGNDSSAPKDVLPLQTLDDDVPHEGGGDSLSRRELEDVRAEVDADCEGEVAGMKNKGKRKKMEPRNPSGHAYPKKLQKFSNRITMKNISPGMKLWGVVSEVSQKDIVVNLPGGLHGLVRATEAIDPLSIDWDLPSIFHVGQLVSCIVLQRDDDFEKERAISLSLRLSLLHKEFSFDLVQQGMVLSGYVKNIEDHGYMLHFGLNSFSGFMPKDDQFEAKLGTEVKVGQLIQGVVKNIDISQKLLYMSSDPDVVSKSVTKDLKGTSIDLLIPGMLVDAVVRSSIENGVLLSFLTYFTGTADIFNLNETFPTSKWKDKYPPNKKVNARILFIDPSSRAVGLTLNAHLVQNRPPPTLVETGEKFDRSKVIRVDKGCGLLLEIPSLPTSTPAYVCISEAADKKVKKLEEAFKEGSHVRVRVLGFSHLEGLSTGTLKELGVKGVKLWKDSRVLDFDGYALLKDPNIARMSKGEQRAEFIQWVNNVLKNHMSPELDDIRIRFGLFNSTEKSLDTFLEKAFLKHVRRLELDLSFRDSSVSTDFIHTTKFHGMPTFGKRSYGFPRLESGNEVTEDPHWRKGDTHTLILTQFKFLKSLRLSGVAVTGDVLEFILRKFPYLERLKVSGSPNLVGIKVCGFSLALKYLEVTHCEELSSMVVRDTNIVSLRFGRFHWIPLKVFEVENNPKLRDVCVYEPVLLPSSNPPLFTSSSLEIFTICLRGYLHYMDGAGLLEMVSQLTKVKQLVIVLEEVLNDSFIHLPSLIGSMSNLKHFVFKLNSASSGFKQGSRSEELSHPNFNNLELFEFQGYCSCPGMDEVIIQVVENAPALEQVTMKYCDFDAIRFPHNLFGQCCDNPIRNADHERFPHDLFDGCTGKLEKLKEIQGSAEHKASKLMEKIPPSVRMVVI